jgi:hypothetical protein
LRSNVVITIYRDAVMIGRERRDVKPLSAVSSLSEQRACGYPSIAAPVEWLG